MSQWPQPTIAGIRSMESNSAGVWETHDTTSSCHLDLPLRGETPQSSQPNFQMEDQLTGQDTSLIEAATQTASATTSVVKLTSPIVPPNWTEEEKQYILVVTTLVRSLDLETTGVILREMVTALQLEEGPSGIPIWQLFSQDLFEKEGVISNQGATMKELGKKDAEWEQHKGLAHDCLWAEG